MFWILLFFITVIQILPYSTKISLFFPSLTNLLIIYWSIKIPNRFKMENIFFFGLIIDFFSYSVPGIRAFILDLLTFLIKLKFRLLSKSSIFKQIINVTLLSFIIKINLIFLESFTIHIFCLKLYISCIIDGITWPFFLLLMNKKNTSLQKHIKFQIK